MTTAGALPDDRPAAKTGTFALFLCALALGFRHPVRAIMALILPLTILFVLSRLFLRTSVYIDFGLFIGLDDPTVLPRMLGPRPSSTLLQSSPVGAWAVWLISFGFLVYWFGTWQRGVARRFSEPTDIWLKTSLRNFPATLLACAIWFLAPFLLNEMLIAIASRVLVHAGMVAPNAPFFDPNQSDAEASASVMWMFLLLRLPGLWLFARLSTLPPLVAARGSLSVRAGWALSSGRGFSLSLCFAIGILLSVAAMYFCHDLIVRLLKREIVPGLITLDLYEEARRWMPWPVVVVDRITWTLTMLWIATLPALAVRSSLAPEAIDPPPSTEAS